MRSYLKSTSIMVSVSLLGGFSYLADLPEAHAAVLEEVVVTARKRAENLQETPVSVVAFSPEALDAQNISDLTDLNAKLPSVHLGGSGGMGSNNAGLFIRGLGTARNAVNQESAVALYIDDFYYGRSDGALLSVVDVANIEVLRGPQGTLFGRNATAGAIRYITKKPELGEFTSKISASVGTDSKADLSVNANIPLNDTAALGLLAATVNQDGYVENALGEELGEKSTNLLRAYLKWDLSENVEILAQVDYSDTDSFGGVSVGLNVDPVTRDVISTDSGDWEKSTSLVPANYESDTLGLGFTVNWNLGSEMDLKWSSTYRTLDVKGDFDFDGKAAKQFENRNLDRGTDAWSTELQLSGGGDSFTWMTGLFYYVEESDDFRLSDGLGASIRLTNYHDLDSIGIFGQGSFDINDQLSITAGLRYTEDDKDASFSEANPAGVLKTYGPDMITEITNADTWDAVTGRLSLEYQAADDLFLFASYSRGFRSGGINDRPRADVGEENNFAITAFDEESVDSFEIGLRSEFLDNRVRLNLTAFYQELEDLQFNFLLPGTTRNVIDNAAEAETKGFEGELIFVASDSFTFDANFGYLDGEITAAEPGSAVKVGDRMSSAPEVKYSLGATYDVELEDAFLSFRIDYSYTDEFISTTEGSGINIGDYSLLGFNIRYVPGSEKWDAAVYGKNVNDEEYFTFATIAGPSRNGVPARLSEYGVKFNYNF